MELAGNDVINLGIGNPDRTPPDNAVSQLQQSVTSEDAHGYQPYGGLPALRSAMAQWYRRIYGVIVDPDRQVLPLLGAKEGIFYLSMAYLDPGDQVLVPDPGYAAYARATRLAGGTPLTYDLLPEHQWLPDLTALEAMDTSRIRCMWLNYPHMPTGALASRSVLDRLVAFALERDILLCMDNPYSLVNNAKPPISLLSVPGSEHCAVELNSLSKSHHMAGWRVGMLIGPSPCIDTVLQVKSNVDSGMFRPVQEAAIAALQVDAKWRKAQDARYRSRQELVIRLLTSLGCHVAAPAAGLFVWARIPNHAQDAASFTDRLLHSHAIFLTPGSIFGQNGRQYVRASLCISEDRIEEAIHRITLSTAMT